MGVSIPQSQKAKTISLPCSAVRISSSAAGDGCLRRARRPLRQVLLRPRPPLRRALPPGRVPGCRHRRLALRRPPPRPPLPQRPVCDPPPLDHLDFPPNFSERCVVWLCASRNSARFLWKSLPQEVKDARPELAAVWRIGQCLWNRDYALVYTATQGFEWGPELADFVTAFLESYRKRIFQLLTSPYSTISVADVAHFMGMSEEDATNYAVQNGWSLDAATKMLTVKKPKVQTNQKLDASKLQRLTECVFHLEH
ncbi:COP9 signalosome complex subunit 8-like isoform X2 [Phragmites australis]|uniref:COP9 signalosome complex subunit 8-like isoform X2 n=1 Tax=Phragmites australis TaxID=29695 RepID=UPI002D7817C5|nr:COP9 signalosome complex subunit 8-like isoform X2 [Phragmites australis]